MLNGTSFIAMRSIISKLASADELGSYIRVQLTLFSLIISLKHTYLQFLFLNFVGKLNSLFAIGDGIAPLAYGPLYTVAYNQMLDTFPGFFFILGGILTIPSVIIFL